MQKTKYIIYAILVLLTFIITFKILDICISKHDDYLKTFNSIKNQEFKGLSARRGRILDVNGKVLVDNVGVNTLVYSKQGASLQSEIDLSLKLASILDIDESYATIGRMKTFYLKTHNNGKDLITSEEYDLYNKRKLTKEDIDALKYGRVDEEILASMSYEERIASYIYSMMQKGYSYQNKIIKKGLSDEEVAKISELDLKGVSVILTWKRIYPYGSTLRTIFGSISDNSLPKELKDHYMSRGLSLDSTVGVSSLELEYDEYLRGKEAIYKINELGRIEKVSDEIPGNDLYLSIDIDTQLKVEEILKNEMLLAKKALNTEYYNHSYVFVGHPKTGEIVAACGLLLSKDHFIDITTNIISSSYTVGSIVKGASMSVGFKNNLIEKGKKITDACVKVYGVQEKCSWARLGQIDEISAMAQSSNYYQFLIAARLANPNYHWNAKLGANVEHFNMYRDVFKSYGLGAITGVDLPNERVGIIGNKVSDDLLLNLSIGQYDTYTPMEIFQYINTLANDGVRIKPSFMNKIVNGEEIIKTNENEVLNDAILNEEDMKRVQLGLREVMISGTGRNYTNKKVTSAGKTGTSETFIDTTGDGKIDTKTTSTAFIMYAPFDNPEYSIAIISPNISHSNNGYSYKYSLNLRVNNKIFNYLFEN